MILSKSGVTREQSALIDDLHARLGNGAIMRLATAFYTRVFCDEQAWFREIFDGVDKDDAIRNQYEWLVQRLGGPALFSQRKGHPGLMWRHNTFAVTESAAVRWLEHMEAALAEDATGDAHAEFLWSRAVTVGWLLDFTNRYDCWDWTTREVQAYIIKPETAATRCRYADLEHVRAAAGVGSADVMVSRASALCSLLLIAVLASLPL